MLNESIIKIRVALQNAGLKKSGKNKFAGFDYFELSDFLPKLNELMLEEGMNDLFSIYENSNGVRFASLTLIKGEEEQEYTIPFVLFETPVNIKTNEKTGETKEVKSMQQIQYLGALNTYYKRYLYLNAFGITDGEVIDSMDNDGLKNTKKMASENQVVVLNKLADDIKEKLYAKYKVSSFEELTMVQASEIISKLKGTK